jgi:hypothetical protein
MQLFLIYEDNNIFHNFYQTLSYPIDDITEVIVNRSSNPWKLFFLRRLFPNARIRNYAYDFIPQLNMIAPYDHMRFIKYSIIPNILSAVTRTSSKDTGEYILINQRPEDDRYVYADDMPLEVFLKDMPIKVVNFGKMTPAEQAEACSKAKLFISAHGAGCTNLIYTPIDCPLIEINFRKNWYCDPVCDKHFSGELDINKPCGSQLKIPFHKADYHNLCYAIGKPYYEVEALRYEEIANRNPISKKRIYISGQELIELIRCSVDSSNVLVREPNDQGLPSQSS